MSCQENKQVSFTYHGSPPIKEQTLY